MMFHPDRHIDEIARSEPPRGHVGRVLARSGPGTAAIAPRGVPWRWALPVAATVVAMAGVWWQSDRASRVLWFDLPGQAAHWSGKGVDLPVLPPEAYWAMSPFEEFERLRPARRTEAHGATRDRRPAPPEADPAIVAYWTPRAPTLDPIVIEDISPEPLVIAPLELPDPIVIEPIVVEPVEIHRGG